MSVSELHLCPSHIWFWRSVGCHYKSQFKTQRDAHILNFLTYRLIFFQIWYCLNVMICGNTLSKNLGGWNYSNFFSGDHYRKKEITLNPRIGCQEESVLAKLGDNNIHYTAEVIAAGGWLQEGLSFHPAIRLRGAQYKYNFHTFV